MKAIFESYDYPVKIVLLILLSIFFSIIMIGISVAILSIYHGISFDTALNMANDLENIGSTKFFLLFQHLGMFILPAIVFSMLITPNPISFFKLNHAPATINYLLAASLVFAFLPFINWSGALNENMHLPALLKDIEAIFRNMEEVAEVMTKKLLEGEEIPTLLINICLIAILPAIGEELFFRGSMQNIFSGLMKNAHLGIWITAFLFSCWHLQFFSFLPRFILGGLLGYLYVWSGSLWLPIMAHFANNLMGVVFMYLTENRIVESHLDEVGNDLDTSIYVLFSIPISALIIYSIFKTEAKKRALIERS